MKQIMFNGITYDGNVVIKKITLPNEMKFDDAIDYVMEYNHDIEFYRSFSGDKNE